MLAKLEWYRRGDCISDQRWRDVLGVIKVQAQRLDQAYLHYWANELGIADLLVKALNDAGLARS